MRELLYIPQMNPPEHVLHHAILYRDSISAIVPFSGGEITPTAIDRAIDAGIFRYRRADHVLSSEQFGRDILEGAKIGLCAVLERNPRLRLYLFRSMIDAVNISVDKPVDPPAKSTTKTELRVLLDAVMEAILEDWNPGWEDVRDGQFGDSNGISSELSSAEFFTVVITVAMGLSLARHSRREVDSPLIIPCYPEQVSSLVRACNPKAHEDHLLARIDVGSFLPAPPAGVDTAAVIDFRRRYDDERQRLIRAVEYLVKDSVRAHGIGESSDIERDVREELDKALADMTRAGQGIFGGWVRRAAWFTVATGAGAVAGPAGAAAGSVAANWASNSIHQRASGNDYTYLYRVRNALDDFTRTTN